MFLELDSEQECWRLWDKEPEYVDYLFGSQNDAKLLATRHTYKDIRELMEAARVSTKPVTKENSHVQNQNDQG